ncbi:hypothetical protein HHI36_003175 [Cryptolaemus montrouzieri]|uniref:PDZ domain-containing protein n=1 Tax=Cryptolaemus montrouzieri TaxID=559131 RepID=A0ABD2PE61_9CUCU
MLNTEWAQVEVIDLINDGSGLAFGIIGGRSTGVVVKTILPGGVADRFKAICLVFKQEEDNTIFVPLVLTRSVTDYQFVPQQMLNMTNRNVVVMIVLFMNITSKIECYQCEFFKNLSLRVTPMTALPLPDAYEINNFNGCIANTSFEETLVEIIFYNQIVKIIGTNAVSNMPELNKSSKAQKYLRTVWKLDKSSEEYIQ